MTNYKINPKLTNLMILLLVIYLCLFSELVEQIIISSLVFVIMVYRLTFHKKLYRHRLVLFITYSTLLVLQIVYFSTHISFGENIFYIVFKNIVGIGLVFLPFVIEGIVSRRKELKFMYETYFESLSFSAIKENIELSDEIVQLKKMQNALSYENFSDIADDLPRHSSIRYINKNTLSDEYFKVANENLDDPYVYIIVSNTGSSASQIISLFTKTEFSHVSIAFDKDLVTAISYNGGERVYPPGLNQERLEFFKKKDDASILVYGLNVGMDNKSKMIKKIAEINREGSAYNLLGLALKVSFKENIMYCSQFVYYLLSYAGCQYFKPKTKNMVKPTDFIELDYERRLEYLYTMDL